MTAEKIPESAIQLRLDPANWPADLKPNASLEVTLINRAFREAADLYARYRQFRDGVMASGEHTPLGVMTATREWADRELPAQRERLEKKRGRPRGSRPTWSRS